MCEAGFPMDVAEEEFEQHVLQHFRWMSSFEFISMVVLRFTKLRSFWRIGSAKDEDLISEQEDVENIFAAFHFLLFSIEGKAIWNLTVLYFKWDGKEIRFTVSNINYMSLSKYWLLFFFTLYNVKSFIKSQ